MIVPNIVPPSHPTQAPDMMLTRRLQPSWLVVGSARHDQHSGWPTPHSRVITASYATPRHATRCKCDWSPCKLAFRLKRFVQRLPGWGRPLDGTTTTSLGFYTFFAYNRPISHSSIWRHDDVVQGTTVLYLNKDFIESTFDAVVQVCVCVCSNGCGAWVMTRYTWVCHKYMCHKYNITSTYVTSIYTSQVHMSQV